MEPKLFKNETTTIDRDWYAGSLKTEMHFKLTEEQAKEILTLWRNKEWQTKRKVKTFHEFYNDHGYHKCHSYSLKDAEATNAAGMSNYRKMYGVIFHWIDASNVGEPKHTYGVWFISSYEEMIL